MVGHVERSVLYVPFSKHMRATAAAGAKGVLFVDAGGAGQVLPLLGAHAFDGTSHGS